MTDLYTHRQCRAKQDSRALRSQLFAISSYSPLNTGERKHMLHQKQDCRPRTSYHSAPRPSIAWPGRPNRPMKPTAELRQSAQRQRYVPRASCIATGFITRACDEDANTFTNDDTSPASTLNNWPFPAEVSTAEAPRIDTAMQTKNLDPPVHLLRTSEETTSVQGAHRHVKQSASYGSPSTSTTLFQSPRAAPGIPDQSGRARKTSVTSNIAAGQESPRLRSHTLHEPSTMSMRGLVSSIKRAYSFNDHQRDRKQTRLMVTTQTTQSSRSRASLRASMNKALPPIVLTPPAADGNRPDMMCGEGDLVPAVVTSVTGEQQKPQLPVLELESFLHDLTLANSPFLAPTREQASATTLQDTEEGPEIII